LFVLSGARLTWTFSGFAGSSAFAALPKSCAPRRPRSGAAASAANVHCGQAPGSSGGIRENPFPAASQAEQRATASPSTLADWAAAGLESKRARHAANRTAPEGRFRNRSPPGLIFSKRSQPPTLQYEGEFPTPVARPWPICRRGTAVPNRGTEENFRPTATKVEAGTGPARVIFCIHKKIKENMRTRARPKGVLSHAVRPQKNR